MAGGLWVSVHVRRATRATARLLMLAAAAIANSAFSQSEAWLSPTDASATIAKQIVEIQSRDGIYAPELIGPLTELAVLHQENGNLQVATAVIERARQVVSINYGLHTLDEALLMQRLIRIEEARGNVDAAWNLEQQLLALIRRHPNDLRTVPILHGIADRRAEVLSRYTNGEFPREIVLGCYYSWDGRSSCAAGSRRIVIERLSFEAAVYRAIAERLLARHERWLDSPCTSAPAPAIPERELSRREVRAVKLEVQRYLAAVYDFRACLKAKHDHARSTGAPSAELSQLVADDNAVIEDLTRLDAVYRERVGSFADLYR